LPDVRRRLALLAVDAPVALTVLRAGTELKLSLLPRAKGAVLGEELSCPRWDFTVK
jgi:serine protease Do